MRVWVTPELLTCLGARSCGGDPAAGTAHAKLTECVYRGVPVDRRGGWWFPGEARVELTDAELRVVGRFRPMPILPEESA